ncbi:MAG: DNA topoisomerase (ATP-hydrolyzing) subunit A [Myxococcota bacterium]
MDPNTSEVLLSEEAQRLYMNYALSVITSRAIPDVRDGLKPVQRRILYAMQSELRVLPDAKPAKCARIVGDVIGKYHPHGESAVYDALVRMTQDWVMRAPLVTGQGNFGNVDGDPPAAYRYTEAKLAPITMELLAELDKKTVAFRPTFDNERSEPTVLPARFPNLLVNGSQGIAVGMATSVPPHNLGEVLDACVALIQDRELSNAQLLKFVKGPDFPTGGELITDRRALRQVYEAGNGTLAVRATYTVERERNQERIVITSVPYGVLKSALQTKIADVIIGKKLPGLFDVRDESTEEIRLVLELKKGTSPELVMAYLYKHTPLQTNVSVNLTCLVPSENPQVPTPKRLDLRSMLLEFLAFRAEVVQNRLRYDHDRVRARIHILEGLERVFDALDEILALIRKSDGKADAAKKLMKRFDLDEEQTEAILGLRLYQLARLEILVIREELEEKRKEETKLAALLKSPAKRWSLIAKEMTDLRSHYADRRRTKIVGGAKDPEFSETDFIVDEDSMVIVSARGWVKRQQTVRDLAATRVKEGDRVMSCLAGSTRASAAFFTNLAHCYVTRIADVPASTGYGDPVQRLFKLNDGEVVVAAASFDPRWIQFPEEEEVYEDGTPAPPYGVAVTKKGLAFRFPLWPHQEPSTRSGRKFGRLKEDDRVLAVFVQKDEEDGFIVAAADDGHAIAVDLEEIPVLAGPGRGSQLIKLDSDASLIAALISPTDQEAPLEVRTTKGKKVQLWASELRASRASRGRLVVKTTGFAEVEWPLPQIPILAEEDED